MDEKEIEWLNEIYRHYEFYLIKGKIYLNIHRVPGVGNIYKPFERVVGCDFFNIEVEEGDVTSLICDLYFIDEKRIPQSFSLIQEFIYEARVEEKYKRMLNDNEYSSFL